MILACSVIVAGYASSNDEFSQAVGDKKLSPNFEIFFIDREIIENSVYKVGP